MQPLLGGGLIAGKIDTLGLAGAEFYGDYRTQFMNAAFNFSADHHPAPAVDIWRGCVLSAATGHHSVGFGARPQRQSDQQRCESSIQRCADPRQRQADGPAFGLVGHQRLGFTWNNHDRFSLSQDPSNMANLLLIERFPALANQTRF